MAIWGEFYKSFAVPGIIVACCHCLQDERVTSVVARTFSPTFSHHLEFPVPQVFSGHHDDAASLAHALESGQVELEVWHKVPGVPGSE